VPEDRLKRFTEENREMASSMQREEKRRAKEEKEARKSTATAASKRKSTLGGSELGSVRLSEERSSSMQAPMRGTKRGRDYEIEKVGLRWPWQTSPADSNQQTPCRMWSLLTTGVFTGRNIHSSTINTYTSARPPKRPSRR